MEVSPGTDTVVENPQQKAELVEDEKRGLPSFRCSLYDTEVVRKISQAFLPGIASACVDNTCGDLFKTPASVAADMRREMAQYVRQRSESFVAESVAAEGGPEAVAFCHPFDVVSDFVDDFAASKRNLLSRVSGWLASDGREDKIDDFVQQMELSAFWPADKRDPLARDLVGNVDFRHAFHCNAAFASGPDLAGHVHRGCGFRPLTCRNEGCDSVFSQANSERHASVCPFKVVLCEQKCGDRITRREMDRHCVTVCPMRIVSCPFYAVGCESAVPRCNVEQHCSDELRSHLVCVVRTLHKKMSPQDLSQRVDQLENASSLGQLKRARDARSLSALVKDLEAKLGPFKPSRESKNKEETTETPRDDPENPIQDQVSS